MSINKKKRKCPRTGKSLLSKNYYLKHRFEGDEKPVEITLGTADKRTAETRAKDYIRNEEKKRSGLYVTDRERSIGARELTGYADEYIEFLIEKGTIREHYRKVRQRLSDGLAELNWTKLSHINRAEYQEWMRSKQQWSPKTQSHYQTTFKSFCRWLFDEGYTEEIPLTNLRRIRNTNTPSVPPGALTAEEAKCLLQSCPEYRSDFYAIMLCTGLRAIEVSRLKVDSITTDEKGRSWICLKEDESKARRFEYIEIPSQLIIVIERLIAGRNQNAKLLPKGRPTRATFRKDLERAGIEKVRFDGSRITMHSLRKTFVTMIHQLTDSDATKRQLARHTSVQMSDALYTDRKALNYHDLLVKLPDMVPEDQNSNLDENASDATDNREVAT
tara:strand:- start:6417 stop:7577 length:1161 start_codon:yes stop_codon:yes gene_type:complete